MPAYFIILKPVLSLLRIANELCTYSNNQYLAKPQTLMRFSSESGISGRVFSQNRVAYKNGDKLEHSFMIQDNIDSYSYISSFIFIPLLDIENKPIGVLQLYNKKGGIDKEEVRELMLLQRVLGQIVECIIELSEALDFVVSAKFSTARIMEATDNNEENLVFLFIKED